MMRIKKKPVHMLCILGAISLLLSACAGTEAAEAAAGEDMPIALVSTAGAGGENGAEAEADIRTGAPAGSGLLDLTVLSSILVYSEVYNIMMSPEEYLGRTIKMQGQYYASYFDATEKYYHFVVIEDAAACCQQGLEFIWAGEHRYPEEYPADGVEVEVTGEFKSYEELGITYYYLETDEITEI